MKNINLVCAYKMPLRTQILPCQCTSDIITVLLNALSLCRKQCCGRDKAAPPTTDCLRKTTEGADTKQSHFVQNERENFITGNSSTKAGVDGLVKKFERKTGTPKIHMPIVFVVNHICLISFNVTLTNNLLIKGMLSGGHMKLPSPHRLCR